MKQQAIERLWNRIDCSDECWRWLGAHSKNGRATVTINTRQCVVYRVTWELTYGPIPAGMNVCHSCDNPWCVRPSHLFLGTQADNQRDMRQKQRSHRPIGETNNGAKLNEVSVKQIRELAAMGFSMSDIARNFGVTYSNIHAIVSRRSWAHL